MGKRGHATQDMVLPMQGHSSSWTSHASPPLPHLRAGLPPTRPAGPHRAPWDNHPCLAALPQQWGPLVCASPSDQIRGSQGRETTLSPSSSR